MSSFFLAGARARRHPVDYAAMGGPSQGTPRGEGWAQR
jgi:hypothetical protein